MVDYKQYKRKGLSEMTPWVSGLKIDDVSISQADLDNGSPQSGDMIARNPKDHSDKWLVAKQYFEDNLELNTEEVDTIDTMEKIENITFGRAIYFMQKGEKVARSGWNGKGMFLFLVPGSNFKVNRAPLLGIYPEGTEINYQPHIDMKTADNTIVPWLASQSDMLTSDWRIVDEKDIASE